MLDLGAQLLICNTIYAIILAATMGFLFVRKKDPAGTYVRLLILAYLLAILTLNFNALIW